MLGWCRHPPQSCHVWEVGSCCPAAGARFAAWQEAKLALFCGRFLLFLNKKVKNPTSSGAAGNTVREYRVVLFRCNLGRRSIRKGTPEQPFAVQLIWQPSRCLAGEVSSSTSCCQKITPRHGITPGPGIHLLGGDCGPVGCWGFGEPWAERITP